MRILLLLLLPTICLAGQKYQHKDRLVQDEFVQVYHDMRAVTTDRIETLSVVSINSTFIGLGRNRFINGDMRIDQRRAGAVVTLNVVAETPVLDGFYGRSNSGDGIYTVQRLTTTPPTGFSHYAHIAVTGVNTSLSSRRYGFMSLIEGSNVRDLLWGTANAKTVTVSFWVRSSLSGTFSGVIHNSGLDRCYIFNYSINSANAWEYKTATIPGDTTGTWLTDAGRGLNVQWDLGYGTSYENAAGVWVGSERVRTPGSVALILNSGATWDITGVQFEVGSVASAFEYRPQTIELALCQRYFEKSYAVDTALADTSDTNNALVSATQLAATTVRSSQITYRVTKRIAPTVTLYNAVDGTTGNWTWISTGGVQTARTTTAPNISIWGHTVGQAVALEFIGFGQWAADASL